MKIHDDPDDQDYIATMRLNARSISDEQFQRFEGYAAEIFSAFGMDVNTPSTKDTPRRFIKALYDATDGYDGDPKLLRVFEKGRTLESANDLTSSPLTAFMYRSLGHAGTQQALEQARRMFDASLAPREFLQALDRGMVRAVIDACSRIAVSRKAALQELAQVL